LDLFSFLHPPIRDLFIYFFIFNLVDNKKGKQDSEMLKVFNGFYLRDTMINICNLKDKVYKILKYNKKPT